MCDNGTLSELSILGEIELPIPSQIPIHTGQLAQLSMVALTEGGIGVSHLLAI